MGGIKPAPVPPTPSLPGSVGWGDRIATAVSLLDHYRL
jgi:hypothetical protein